MLPLNRIGIWPNGSNFFSFFPLKKKIHVLLNWVGSRSTRYCSQGMVSYLNRIQSSLQLVAFKYIGLWQGSRVFLLFDCWFGWDPIFLWNGLLLLIYIVEWSFTAYIAMVDPPMIIWRIKIRDKSGLQRTDVDQMEKFQLSVRNICNNFPLTLNRVGLFGFQSWIKIPSWVLDSTLLYVIS